MQSSSWLVNHKKEGKLFVKEINRMPQISFSLVCSTFLVCSDPPFWFMICVLFSSSQHGANLYSICLILLQGKKWTLHWLFTSLQNFKSHLRSWIRVLCSMASNSFKNALIEYISILELIQNDLDAKMTMIGSISDLEMSKIGLKCT